MPHLTSRPRNTALAVILAAAAAGCATTQAAGAATATCNVTSYGADASGAADSTQAIRKAINACAASAGPNTVYFPAGTYAVSDTGSSNPTIRVAGPNPVILQGAGRDATKLVEHVGVGNTATCPGGGGVPGPSCPVRSLLGIAVDGAAVEDMTLDTATYNAGTALGTTANNGTYLRLRVTHGGLGYGYFPVYFAGPAGATRTAPMFNTGNKIDDLILNEGICDDGLSFSFQANGSISHVQHTGSRLALYIDNAVTVTDYSFTPGSQSCSSKKQGFFVTSPSSDITINGFTSSGGAGVVGQGSEPSTNITLNDYRLTGSGATLEVGDVEGFVVQSQSSGCDMGSGNILRVDPTTVASGITVRNCSLAMVHFFSPPSVPVTDLTFAGDTFVQPSPQTYTFSDLSNMNATVAIAGGAYHNCPSSQWFSNSSSLVFVGTQSLAGYPC